MNSYFKRTVFIWNRNVL